MKKITGFTLLLLLLLQVPVLHHGQEYRESVSDGPYVFRKENQVLVYHIHNNQKVTKSYRLKMAGPRYRSRNFTVKIRAFKKQYIIPTAPPKTGPEHHTGIKKIFVVSDIHGQFTWFKDLLLNNNIVNKKMKWKWGKGHLVVLGDVFDRGPQVTETLWLIHQLEQQAKRKGGRVHFLLGNHEVMVLKNDLRYVHPKYTHASEHILGIPITALYGTDSVLGQWIRTKHTAIKLNHILFVHGGIHPEVLTRGMDITALNTTVRNNLDTPKETVKADELLNFLFYRNGPLWYRGYFPDKKKYPRLGPGDIQRILDYFSVKHIIVGHSTQEHITPLYDKKVFAVDSGIKHGDRGEALLWENGKFHKTDVTGKLNAL